MKYDIKHIAKIKPITTKINLALFEDRPINLTQEEWTILAKALNDYTSLETALLFWLQEREREPNIPKKVTNNYEKQTTKKTRD